MYINYAESQTKQSGSLRKKKNYREGKQMNEALRVKVAPLSKAQPKCICEMLSIVDV